VCKSVCVKTIRRIRCKVFPCNIVLTLRPCSSTLSGHPSSSWCTTLHCLGHPLTVGRSQRFFGAFSSHGKVLYKGLSAAVKPKPKGCGFNIHQMDMGIIPRSKGHSFEMGFKIRRRFGVWTYTYAYMRVSTCLEVSVHVKSDIYIYTYLYMHMLAQGIPTCKAPRKSDPGVPWRQCHDLGDRGPKEDRDDRGVPGT